MKVWPVSRAPVLLMRTVEAPVPTKLTLLQTMLLTLLPTLSVAHCTPARSRFLFLYWPCDEPTVRTLSG